MDNEYSAGRLLVFTGVFAALQVIFVALRMATRVLNHKARGWDDVVILVALAGQLGMAGTMIAYIKEGGIGYHTAYLSQTNPEKLVIGFKYSFVVDVLYVLFVNVPKLALLLLYNRVFPRPLRVNLFVRLLMVFLILHTIGTTIALFVICHPSAVDFDYIHHPHSKNCGNAQELHNLYIWESLPNVVSDVAILVLPMTVIWRATMDNRMKLGLAVTFSMGGLDEVPFANMLMTYSRGLIVSILRFINYYRDASTTDPSWAAVTLEIYTQAEIGTYLICACLPTFRPFLNCSFRERHVPLPSIVYDGNPAPTPTPTRNPRPNSFASWEGRYWADAYRLDDGPKDHLYGISSWSDTAGKRTQGLSY